MQSNLKRHAKVHHPNAQIPTSYQPSIPLPASSAPSGGGAGFQQGAPQIQGWTPYAAPPSGPGWASQHRPGDERLWKGPRGGEAGRKVVGEEEGWSGGEEDEEAEVEEDELEDED